MDRFDPRLLHFDPNTHYDATSLLNQSTGRNNSIPWALQAIADLNSVQNIGAQASLVGGPVQQEIDFLLDDASPSSTPAPIPAATPSSAPQADPLPDQFVRVIQDFQLDKGFVTDLLIKHGIKERAESEEVRRYLYAIGDYLHHEDTHDGKVSEEFLKKICKKWEVDQRKLERLLIQVQAKQYKAIHLRYRDECNKRRLEKKAKLASSKPVTTEQASTQNRESLPSNGLSRVPVVIAQNTTSSSSSSIASPTLDSQSTSQKASKGKRKERATAAPAIILQSSALELSKRQKSDSTERVRAEPTSTKPYNYERVIIAFQKSKGERELEEIVKECQLGPTMVPPIRRYINVIATCMHFEHSHGRKILREELENFCKSFNTNSDRIKKLLPAARPYILFYVEYYNSELK